MHGTEVITFDRSRHEAWQRCPRQRFWQYEWQGRGLERLALSIPLHVGSCVHGGIEKLLTGWPLEGAVAAALLLYDIEVSERGLDEGPQGEANPLVASMRAIIEALVRGWHRIVLPRMEAEFEVVEVEREEEAAFAVNGSSFRFLARLDVLNRRRSDGALFVRNFKTVSSADQWWMEGFRYDTQTISEVVAVEQRLQQRVSGVVIDGLIKGSRRVEWPKGSGLWHHNSPLIWAWCKRGNPPLSSDEWSTVYEWKDEQGATKRLGRGWERVPVWEAYEGGVAGWLNYLSSAQPQLLAEQFITLPPILRSDWEVESWKRQTLAVELRIARSAEACRNANGDLHVLLDEHFPKSTHGGNCIRPSRCPCFSLCWGAVDYASLLECPQDMGYTWRKPNHPAEFDNGTVATSERFRESLRSEQYGTGAEDTDRPSA